MQNLIPCELSHSERVVAVGVIEIIRVNFRHTPICSDSTGNTIIQIFFQDYRANVCIQGQTQNDCCSLIKQRPLSGDGGLHSSIPITGNRVSKWKVYLWSGFSYLKWWHTTLSTLSIFGMSRHSSRSSSSAITLYDIPGSSPQPWAPNIWRIRFILNYKGIRYRTVWVELPDVEVTLHSVHAPPTSYRSNGQPVYTLPVIVDPGRNPSSPVILSNSGNIAEYLEATYPSRPLFPPGSRAVQTLFVHYIQEVFAKPLLPIMVPLSHQRLPGRSQDYFRPQGQSTGQPLPAGPQREQAWLAAKEQFDFLATIMAKNAGDGDGVVAMGHEVSYADFVLCSVLIWIERMAPHDGWSRIRSWNGGRWERLWDRCKPYMAEC